jgi:hypothetical protein
MFHYSGILKDRMGRNVVLLAAFLSGKQKAILALRSPRLCGEHPSRKLL